MDDPRDQVDWLGDEQLRRVASVILREESLVDDVLQEAWLASLRRPQSGGDPERSRLAGMVRHLALNMRRAERRRVRRERVASKLEPLESASEIAARRSVVAALGEAIDQLEEPLQAPVRLHYLAGLEVKQVAARLGRPVPTVRDQLRRGVDRLRERLRGRFGDSHAWGLALIAAFDWDEREVVQSLRSSGWTSAARWIAGGILAGASLVVLVRFQPSSQGEGRPVLDPGASAAAVASGSLPPSAVASAESRNPVDTPGTSLGSAGTDPGDVVHEPTLSLRVVDAGGSPVAGATARIVHLGFERFELVGDPAAAGITDPAGRTSIRLARAWLEEDDGYGEHWSVWVDAQGFARSEVYSIPSASAAAGEVQIELEQPEVVLEGRAFDAEGAPLASGWVALSQIDLPIKQFIRGSMRVRWDRLREALSGDGHFRFTGVRPGTYDLFVQHAEQGMARVRVELPHPGLQVRDVTLSQGAVLQGRVVDAAGNALAEAPVWFLYQSRAIGTTDSPFASVTSASDGTFEIPCLANVPTILRARWGAPDEIIAERTLTPVPGRNAPLELILAPPPILAVDVVDAGGAPVPGLRVAVMTGSGKRDARVRGGTTDDEGHVDIRLGPWQGGGIALLLRDVTASVPLPQQAMRLEPGSTTASIVFDPAEPATIAGALRAAGWAPPADLSIYVEHVETAIGARLPLDSPTGPFRLERIPPASYKVYLNGGEALGMKLGTIDLAEGELHDMGEIDLPAPGSVLFDWRVADPALAGPASVRSLTVLRERWRLWNGEALRETPLELLPGDYSLRVERPDGTTSAWPFHIDSREETLVVVDL